MFGYNIQLCEHLIKSYFLEKNKNFLEPELNITLLSVKLQADVPDTVSPKRRVIMVGQNDYVGGRPDEDRGNNFAYLSSTLPNEVNKTRIQHNVKL